MPLGSLWLLGYPDQALARVHEALALAHALSHPYESGVCAVLGGLRLAVSPGRAGRARAGRGRCRALDRAGLSTLGGLGNELAGVGAGHAGPGRGGDWHRSARGSPPSGPPGQRCSSHTCAPCWRTSADHLGHTADGLQALAEAHTLVEQQEERWWEAEVCRLRGVLLLRQTRTPQAEAEAWLQRALDVARRQEAKSLELRAAMSLSRLWQQQGKRAEAHDAAGPVYGWFTEGFDTADLQEAKALLDALA